MSSDDPRWGSDPRERDDDTRDRDAVDPRDVDARDVFVNKLDLPLGPERELVRDRDREYNLRGSESRTLSIVGAFRVVSSRDLRDHDNRSADPRKAISDTSASKVSFGPCRYGHRDHAVVLTDRGRHLLESHRRDRDNSRDHSQAFYADLKKPPRSNTTRKSTAPTSEKPHAFKSAGPTSAESSSTTS